LEDVDRVVGVRVAEWIEGSGLNLHQTRLLLAIAAHDEPVEIATLASEAGLSVDLAYPSVHELDRRGLTRGEHRHHMITDAGRVLVESFSASRRAAIAAFIDGMDDEQRRRLGVALGVGGS
jgi:predicted transcriptional regulator